MVGIGGQRIPTAFRKGAIGFGKTGNCPDATVLDARADLVAGAIEGSEYVAREPAARVQNGRQRLVVEAGMGLLQAPCSGDFRQGKRNLSEGRGECHAVYPGAGSPE